LSFKFTVSGFKETADALRKMAQDAKTKAYPEIFEPSLDPAVKSAKRKARVKTGYMRDHVYKKKISELEGEYGSEANYSAPQNYGTSKIRGNYFWSDSIPVLEKDLMRNGQKWVNSNFQF
jgi:hypothetical protein